MARPGSRHHDVPQCANHIGKGRSTGSHMRRVGMMLPALLGAWLLVKAVEPVPSAASSPFIDRVVASHRTTLQRQAMTNQPASVTYDPAELRLATGISLPPLPKGWVVRDSQLYPSTYGDIIHVYLLTSGGEQVSLVAMRIETAAEATPLLEDRVTERIAYWENGDLAYALVGQLSSARLLGLAAEFARNEDPV